MPERPWCDDEEDWSETGDDDADGSESDGYDFDADSADSEDTIACPSCRTEIYADLDHCPRCGHWLTDADRAVNESGLFASHNVRLIAAALLVIFLIALLAGTLAIS